MLDVGVHAGLPLQTYLDDPAISKGCLITATTQSWKAARKQMLKPAKETAAMRMGTLRHLYIFEPDLIDEKTVVFKGDRKGAKAQADWQAIIDAGKIPVQITKAGKDERIALEDARRAVWAHPEARGLLNRVRDTEVTFVWDDTRYGRRHKGRVDAITDGPRLELKSCARLNKWPAVCSANSEGLRYDIAEEFYRWGWYESVGEDTEVRWIVVESCEDPDVLVRYPSEYMRNMAGALMEERLAELNACLRDDIWPGMDANEGATEPPQFVVNDYESKYGEPSVGQPKFST